jgi:N-acetylmuramoyl-L-alanine amidase
MMHEKQRAIGRGIVRKNGASRSRAALAGVLILLASAFWADSAPAACSGAGLTVALDIGHAPSAPGATSARGRPEYDFNRDLALRVQDHLRAAGLGAELVVAADGAPPALRDRPRLAAALGADLLLSIHHDSVQPRYLERGELDGQSAVFSRHAEGHSLFVSGKNLWPEVSLSVARAIGTAMADWGLAPTLHHAEPIPGEGRPLLDETLGIYDFAELIVLKTAPMPAVLIEAGVIVHPDEEVRLRDPFHQDILADAIARGVSAACPVLQSR